MFSKIIEPSSLNLCFAIVAARVSEMCSSAESLASTLTAFFTATYAVLLCVSAVLRIWNDLRTGKSSKRGKGTESTGTKESEEKH